MRKFFMSSTKRASTSIMGLYNNWAPTGFFSGNVGFSIAQEITHIGEVEPGHSDHRPFAQRFRYDAKTEVLIPIIDPRDLTNYPLTDMATVLYWNAMMQGKYNKEKQRYNNGFNIVENQAQYQARIRRNIRHVAPWVWGREDVFGFLIGEGPVKEEDVKVLTDAIDECFPAGFKIHNDWSVQGVLTVFNHNRLREISREGTVYSETAAIMNDKLATYAFGKYTTISNLHLPHDAPKAALELLLTGIAQRMVAEIRNGKIAFSQIYVGDWNLDPEVIKDAAQRHLGKLFHGLLPIEIIITVSANPKGHLKSNNQYVTVDSILTVYYKVNNRLALSCIKTMDALLSRIDNRLGTDTATRPRPRT